ncbi:uncharacterized protein V1516DRAFT_693797 [Lipomyces oligophaga]|uniref:uncharacterized protein n=1 Tax=Lipomyces oligophaga TaxID=45792 RepID=UPI0034CF017F
MKRSRTGCPQCHYRKIKCDEKRPSCTPCIRSGKVCQIEAVIIKHHEYSFHFIRQSPRYALPNISRSSPTWVDIPEQLTFVHESASSLAADLEHDEPTDGHMTFDDTSISMDSGRNRTLSAETSPSTPTSVSRPDNSFISEVSAVRHATSNRLKSSTRESVLAFAILDVQDRSEGSLSVSNDSDDALSDEEDEFIYQEESYYLRRFSKVTSKFMACMDSDRYFSRQLPILAQENRLIRYACCALAAKQMGSVAYPEKLPITNKLRLVSKRASVTIDHLWFGAKYYEKAIRLLFRAISPSASGGVSNFFSPRSLSNLITNSHHYQFSETDDNANSSMDKEDEANAIREDENDSHELQQDEQVQESLRSKHDFNDKDKNGTSDQDNNKEAEVASEEMEIDEDKDDNDEENFDNLEIALTICILVSYEHISATERAWSGHVNAINEIMQLILNSRILSSSIGSNAGHSIDLNSRALKTAFWDFALQDLLDSIISNRITRLNAAKFHMWSKMGLDYQIGTENAYDDNLTDEQSWEYLIYLLHMVNDYVNEPQENSVLCTLEVPQVRRRNRITKWKALSLQLEYWKDSLSLGFHGNICVHDNSSLFFRYETWFSDDICAIAMQFYHMACIMLAINCPSEIFLEVFQNNEGRKDFLAATENLHQRLQDHAVSICAIAIANPEQYIKPLMIEPLYMAGRCISNQNDRVTLLSFLTSIQDDYGYNTEYRRTSLIQLWNSSD